MKCFLMKNNFEWTKKGVNAYRILFQLKKTGLGKDFWYKVKARYAEEVEGGKVYSDSVGNLSKEIKESVNAYVDKNEDSIHFEHIRPYLLELKHTGSPVIDDSSIKRLFTKTGKKKDGLNMYILDILVKYAYGDERTFIGEFVKSWSDVEKYLVPSHREGYKKMRAGIYNSGGFPLLPSSGDDYSCLYKKYDPTLVLIEEDLSKQDIQEEPIIVSDSESKEKEKEPEQVDNTSLNEELAENDSNEKIDEDSTDTIDPDKEPGYNKIDNRKSSYFILFKKIVTIFFVFAVGYFLYSLSGHKINFQATVALSEDSSLIADNSVDSTSNINGGFKVAESDSTEGNNTDSPSDTMESPNSSEQRILKREKENKFYQKLQSAKKGNKANQYEVAMAYRRGNGTKRNCKKAVFWLGKAAKDGNPVYLEELYRMMRAITAGSLSSCNHNWTKKELDIESKRMIAIYKKNAMNGDAQAQVRLGDMYMDGFSGEKNYSEAFKWFEKATDQNYLEGANKLGVLYARGMGTKQDTAKAKELFKKVCNSGDGFGCINLGAINVNNDSSVIWMVNY